MAAILVSWNSNDGQIIKSEISDGRRAKFLPSVVAVDYELKVIWKMPFIGLHTVTQRASVFS
jgi:hypothetical protein